MKISDAIKDLVDLLSKHGDAQLKVAVHGGDSKDVDFIVSRLNYDVSHAVCIEYTERSKEDKEPLFEHAKKILTTPRASRELLEILSEVSLFLDIPQQDVRWLIQDRSRAPRGCWDTTYDWVLFMARSTSQTVRPFSAASWRKRKAFYHTVSGHVMVFTEEPFKSVWCSKDCALYLQDIYGPELLEQMGPDYF